LTSNFVSMTTSVLGAADLLFDLPQKRRIPPKKY